MTRLLGLPGQVPVFTGCHTLPVPRYGCVHASERVSVCCEIARDLQLLVSDQIPPLQRHGCVHACAVTVCHVAEEESDQSDRRAAESTAEGELPAAVPEQPVDGAAEPQEGTPDLATPPSCAPLLHTLCSLLVLVSCPVRRPRPMPSRFGDDFEVCLALKCALVFCDRILSLEQTSVLLFSPRTHAQHADAVANVCYNKDGSFTSGGECVHVGTPPAAPLTPGKSGCV